MSVYFIKQKSALLTSTKNPKEMGFEQSIILDNSSQDPELHEASLQLFRESPQPTYLFIQLDSEEDNLWGLRLAAHIRLNPSLSVAQRCIPICLLSPSENPNLEGEDNLDSLLHTPGTCMETFIVTFQAEEIIKRTGYTALRIEHYSDFLRKLYLPRPANTGRHSIGNAWGAYKLARVLGIEQEVQKITQIEQELHNLYAKLLVCKNSPDGALRRTIPTSHLQGKSKNVLLIDDRSKEGWEILMTEIFGNHLKTVKYPPHRDASSFSDFFEKARAVACNLKWDLILVDLRLDPYHEDKEDDNIPPEDLSGCRLIKEILSFNRGMQIIVITASNKIWNVNEALKLGASFYYIKESPKYSYSDEEAREHYKQFLKDAQECFDKAYLRKAWAKIEEIKSIIGAQDTSTSFISEFNKQLDIAYELLHGADSEEKFAYAYVILYMTIEITTKTFCEESSCWHLKEYARKRFYKLNRGSMRPQRNILRRGNTSQYNKIGNLYHLLKASQDSSFETNIAKAITRRNKIIHPDEAWFNRNPECKDLYTHEGFEMLLELVEVISKFNFPRISEEELES